MLNADGLFCSSVKQANTLTSQYGNLAPLLNEHLLRVKVQAAQSTYRHRECASCQMYL